MKRPDETARREHLSPLLPIVASPEIAKITRENAPVSKVTSDPRRETRRLLRALEEKAKSLHATADEMMIGADILHGKARECEAAAERLAIQLEEADLVTESAAVERTKDTAPLAMGARSGPRFKSTHPLAVALENYGGVAKWARSHGFAASSVRSWYAAGSTGRPIPRRAAMLIQAQFGIPATVQSWPKGIR